MRNGQRELGDKLGPRLAALMTEATVAARAKLAPHEAKIHQAATQALIDRAGREVAGLYGPLIREAQRLHDGKAHPLVTDFLTRSASGEHQWEAIAGLTMSAAQSALSALLNNYLGPVVYEVNSLLPATELDQDMSARAVSMGLMSEESGLVNSRGFGYNDGNFRILTAMASQWPAMADIMQLANRRLIDDSELELLLERTGIPVSIREKWLSMRQTPLSPAVLADMVVRGIREQPSAAREAYESGVSEQQFNDMVLDTGAPPAMTDLSLAYRRGFIDKARFVHGIRQSRVRNEWVDVLEHIQYTPMSVADAVTAHVQGHLTEQQVYEIAKVNGLESQYVKTLIESAGAPLSPTEVMELYRRKEITKDLAEQAIREGRLKDKYLPYLLKLTERLPTAREAITFYTHGALTAQQTDTILQQSGYSEEIQKAFIASGTHGKIAVVKEITLHEATQLYLDQIISWDEVISLLKPIGYTADDLTHVKEILDQQIIYKNRQNAIGKVRTLYVGYKIDKNAASIAMDGLGVLAFQRDALLITWGLERDANAKDLTRAEILDGWEYNLIDTKTAQLMLEQQGYSKVNAALLIEIKAKGPVKGLSA